MSAFKTITTDNLTVATTATIPNRLTINNMPTGAANQFLQTNGSGIPIYGAGGGGQAPGTNEQSLWTIGGVTSWQSRSFRYGLTFFNFTNGQDWNTDPQLAITFGSVSSQSRTFGTTAFSPISVQVAGSTLLCNTSGVYMFHVLCPLANTSLLNSSKIGFNVVINGVVTLNPTVFCTILANSDNTLSASFPITLTAGQTISFTSTRNGSIGTAICDGLNSRLSIRFMNSLL